MIKVIRAVKNNNKVYLFNSIEGYEFKNNGYKLKLVNLCIKTRKEVI